ncbi:MAG: hypothetical protein ACOX6N_01375 [Patescibacteria group bacterium]|jgi:guanylate kinase
MSPEGKIGKLAIVTGPTGVGKDSVLKHIEKKFPDIQRIVTDAARLPRDGEVNGVDYNFVNPKEFQRNIDNNVYAEYVLYGGGKATRRKSLLQILEGKSAFWRIDPSRAIDIKCFYEQNFSPQEAEVLINNTVVIYIGTERLTVLKDRFFARDPNAKRTDFLDRIREDWSEWIRYKSRMEENGPVRYNLLINPTGQLENTLEAACEIVRRTIQK